VGEPEGGRLAEAGVTEKQIARLVKDLMAGAAAVEALHREARRHDDRAADQEGRTRVLVEELRGKAHIASVASWLRDGPKRPR
jgi:hypothetical protein